MTESLTPVERRLVMTLIRHYPNAVPYPLIHAAVWGKERPQKSTHIISVNATRIRAKVGKFAITTVGALGLRVEIELLPEWARQQAMIEHEAERIVMEGGGIDPVTARAILRSSRSRSRRDTVTNGVVAKDRRRGNWECLKAPEGCACRCHRLSEGVRRRMAEKGVYQKTRHDAWLPGHDQLLLSLWDELLWLPDVVRELNKRTNSTRTLLTVRVRLVKLGRSVQDGYKTIRSASVALGVSYWVVYGWLASGELPWRYHYSKPDWKIIMDRDLEAFVGRPDVPLSPLGIRDHRLRAIREVTVAAHGRDPRQEEALTS